MLTENRIIELFQLLNDELKKKEETAEVGIIGGAVMCLVFHARKATKDIDAIFKPANLVRKLAERIAEDQNLPKDWLNDAAKGFLQPGFERQEVLNLSHLRVWAPDARYMLAMKCISARWDTHDKDDVQFLIRLLDLKSAKSVFAIIEGYYPKNRISPKTLFLIEEFFE